MGASKTQQRGASHNVGGTGSKSNLQARTFTADSGRQDGIQMKSASGFGQPSHLGVYRHDTSISLMKPKEQPKEEN